MKREPNRREKRTCVHQNVQFVLADSQPRLHFESRLEGSFVTTNSTQVRTCRNRHDFIPPRISQDGKQFQIKSF